MNIRQATDGKEDYIELLRAGDPDESRIRKLLEKGELFLLEEHGKLRTLCIVIFSEEKKCEIKNIVTKKKDQGKGYGRYMIHYICEHYCVQYDWVYMKKERCLDVMEFCEKCGFSDEDEKYLKKELMSEIETKRVINLAMEAGRMLLKNGGEIFRVEETMMRICHRFGVKYVDLFTLSHGLFICAGTDKEKLYTKVKDILEEQLEETKKILGTSKAVIDAMKQRLLDKNQLEAMEIEDIILENDSLDTDETKNANDSNEDYCTASL